MPLQMKNPPHPGELIGDTLEEFGVKITEAAKVLGITRQQLHNLIAAAAASRRKWLCGWKRRSAAPPMRGCKC
jgi:hypothetical protein